MATPVLSNISGYTESDASGWIALTNQRATMANMGRNADSYASYDGGASWVNDINLKFIIYCASTSSNIAAAALAASAFTVTAVNDITGFGTSDVFVSFERDSGAIAIRLGRGNFVATDIVIGLSVNTPYYCLLERSAASDTITCKVYSDAARTSLLDTLSVAGFGTATRFRYHYAAVNYNSGTASTEWDGYFDYEENFGVGGAWWQFM